MSLMHKTSRNRFDPWRLEDTAPWSRRTDHHAPRQHMGPWLAHADLGTRTSMAESLQREAGNRATAGALQPAGRMEMHQDFTAVIPKGAPDPSVATGPGPTRLSLAADSAHGHAGDVTVTLPPPVQVPPGEAAAEHPAVPSAAHQPEAPAAPEAVAGQPTMPVEAPAGTTAEPSTAHTAETPAAQTAETPATQTMTRLPDIVIPGADRLSEADGITPALTYNPTITKSGTSPGPDLFGVTRGYDIRVSNIRIMNIFGAYLVYAQVDNPITYEVCSSTGPNGEQSIDSASDAKITAANYQQVADDLTPDMSDLNGRPPRDQFWAEDITNTHERFHCTDGLGHARDGVRVAASWLGGQTANSQADVQNLLGQVPQKVADVRMAAMTMPGREERAYGDGAGAYNARALMIRMKGRLGVYT
jgi:hypothetical protein